MQHSTISFRIVDEKYLEEVKDLFKLMEAQKEHCRFSDKDRIKVNDVLSSANPFFKYCVACKELRPLRSVFISAQRHSPLIILIETPYFDVEYWDSYSIFYSNTFSDFPRHCERLHFLKLSNLDKLKKKYGEDVSSNLLAEKICKAIRRGSDEKYLIDEYGIDYVGFCVLRPTGAQFVGRTVIKFDHTPNPNPSVFSLWNVEKKGRPILKASHESHAQLINARFTLDSPEFIQQDTNLGMCATASLWVASRINAQNFGTGRFTFGALTRKAFGRTSVLTDTHIARPSISMHNALTSDEIKQAIMSSGLSFQTDRVIETSEATTFRRHIRTTHFIHSFLESCLPVLLLLSSPEKNEGHVITAIGHCLPKAQYFQSGDPKDFLTKLQAKDFHIPVSALITLYYAHDDSYGPYNRVRALLPNELPPNGNTKPTLKGRIARALKKMCNFITDERIFSYRTDNLHDTYDDHREKPLSLEYGTGKTKINMAEAIVPLLPRYRSTPAVTFKAATEIFDEGFNKRMGSEEYDNILKDTNVYWRSLLISSVDFKRSLITRDYHKFYILRYGRLHLPKYIWLHEYSLIMHDDIQSLFPEDGKRKIFGELLFDATAPAEDPVLLAKRMFLGHYWDYSMADPTNNIMVKNSECYECYCDQNYLNIHGTP